MTFLNPDSIAVEPLPTSSQTFTPLECLVDIQQLLQTHAAWRDCAMEIMARVGTLLNSHSVALYAPNWLGDSTSVLDLTQLWLPDDPALGNNGGEFDNIANRMPTSVTLSTPLRRLLTQSEMMNLTPQLDCPSSWRSPYGYLLPLNSNGQLEGAMIVVVPQPLASEALTFLAGVYHTIVLKGEQEHRAAALQTCEERYQHLVETTNEGVWIIDRQFQTTFINAHMAKLLGYAPHELLGRSLWDAIAVAHRQQAKVQFFNLQPDQTQQWQLQLQNHQGERIWVLMSATPMISEAGEEEGMVLMVTDISSQRQAERERDRFFYLSADLCCIANFEGYFQRLNPVWSQVFGYTLDDMLSQPYLSFVHPDDQAETIEQGQQLGQGVQCVNFVNRYRCADGSYRWLEWNAVPYHQEGHIYAVARDITEAKHLEAARQESRQRLEAAQKVAHVGDWEMDLITGQVTWSQELFRIFDIDPQTQVDQLPEVHSSAAIFQNQYLQQIHPDDRALGQNALQQSIINAEAYEIEQRIIRPNGEIRHLLMKGQPRLNDHGQVIRVFGTAMDITELKQAKADVQARLEREQLVAKISTQFMHLDHHELGIGIQDALAQVGTLLGVDRCYVCQLDNDIFNCIYEWCVVEHLSIRALCQRVPLTHLPFRKKQRQWSALQITDTRQPPANAVTLKEFWQQHHITADLKVPLVARGELLGCLSCNMTTGPRQWTTDEITLLRLVGEILANALERRRATRALAESEERFRQLAENVDSVFWMQDVQTRKLIYVSPAYEQVWGRSRDELMNPDFQLLSTIHPDDRQHMLSLFRRVMDKEYDTEYRVLHPGGKMRWIHDRAFPVKNAAGQVYRIIGIAEDISDRKRTEEALHVLIQQTAALIGNEFFQALIQHLAQVLQVQYAFITRCVDQPPTKVETLAFWMGTTFTDNFAYDLKDTPCEKVIYGDTCFYPQDVQQAFPDDPDLVTLNVESYGAMPLFDTNQQVLGHLVIMDSKPLTDVRLPRLILQMFAARAGAELERLQNEEDLRQSEERLQLAILGSNMGLWDWHLPSDRTYFNPQWKQMLGYEPEELPSAYEEWHARVHPEDIDQALALLKTHLSGETPIYQAEFRMLHRAGHWIWVLAHGKVVEWDEAQNPVRITGTHQDITERKAIERMKDEFLSVISHELRTPMTSIHGAIKLLETGKLGEFNPQGQQMLTIAANNTARLSRLINDILNLQRLESGQFSLNCQVCTAKELLNQSIQAIDSIATAEQIQLQLLTPEPELEIWADPDYLMQVFTNLLSNAIKFSPSQSTIELVVFRQASHCCFIVRDRGRGIPADKLDTIFNRFHQVDASDSRQKGGTGLGLAICRHIVQQHGGRIWVESEVDVGSSFYFTCPLASE
ncbi:MAG: PAS domain S-box protein [Spirulina sp. SIO3F2]|nr:PAS domain S-box protein [Spirulina sp. SIO3F2]